MANQFMRAETYYSGEYLGNFVKDATVQILTVDFDETGHVWYQVRFLYGDDFKDGTMKWTDYLYEIQLYMIIFSYVTKEIDNTGQENI